MSIIYDQYIYCMLVTMKSRLSQEVAHPASLIVSTQVIGADIASVQNQVKIQLHHLK